MKNVWSIKRLAFFCETEHFKVRSKNRLELHSLLNNEILAPNN